MKVVLSEEEYKSLKTKADGNSKAMVDSLKHYFENKKPLFCFYISRSYSIKRFKKCSYTRRFDDTVLHNKR